MASGIPGNAVSVEGFHVIDPHNSSDTMLSVSLARFSQIEKDPWGPVDAVARHISCADQVEKPLILQRSIGEGVAQPNIELGTMGPDERLLYSVTLRSTPIAHRSSHVLTTTPKGVR